MALTDDRSEKSLEPPEFTTFGETTTDSFHNNAFQVIQPKGSGYRSGLDALLLAAAVPEDATGTIADLGAGSGVAGLAALCINPGLDLIAVEKNEAMAGLLLRTLLLKVNDRLRPRVDVVVADITANATVRTKAGLEPECVTHAIMNPPYNPITLRPPKDAMRAEALMIGEGGTDAWFRTAASIIKPGGTLSVVYRTEQLGDLIACMQGRFGGLQIVPVHAHADDPAKLLLVRGIRGSRAPLSILQGLVIHNDDGTFTEPAEAIFAGTGRIPTLGR